MLRITCHRKKNSTERKLLVLFCPPNKNTISKVSADDNLTLSETTHFRLFQTERVCRRQFQVYKKGREFSRRVENTVGKGEIARYEQFILFPVFSKDLYCRHVKTRACFGKG